MYTVQPGRCWVTAQSPTVPKVYQPDKELSVNIGDSATLQCYGTLLKIKGECVNNETSKPVVSDNSVVCEPTLHGNNTNMNTQEINQTMIGLGTALGLCALLIFCLTYYILRRRKCDTMNSPETRKKSHFDTFTYAALKGSEVCLSDKLMYSEVIYMKL
ncbi:hypothetical protein KOW79_006997 [Hemibagrus wyckioides]|uniref:Uncharacterized protein n=1 Tax=Hemibagrus wyckioides TaxID=337641 RepID=A0A9D3NTN9_9TELE|nr:hypothetical protein KOW79_006997 [Hemibagrus wyckioides]